MNYQIYNPGNTKPFTTRKSTECIILHHTADIVLPVEKLAQNHLKRGFNGAGYNWYVTKTGIKYQLRPIWAGGAHTIGWNSRSIGICAEGNFEIEAMPEVQKRAVAEVVDYCMDQYGKLLVYGHKNKWPTACPGKNYPFNSIVELAAHWDDKPIFEYPGVVYKLKDKLMRGTAIRAIQQRLNDLGFNCGKTDGWFGEKTDAAVKAFQRSRGLVQDGDVGPATWATLFN